MHENDSAFPCPCCYYCTLSEMPPGTHEICRVCFWHDDNIQFWEEEGTPGPNRVSLIEARETFRRFGYTEERIAAYVEPPGDTPRATPSEARALWLEIFRNAMEYYVETDRCWLIPEKLPKLASHGFTLTEVLGREIDLDQCK